MNASPPLAARVFQVRFGPDKPARGDAWPNNLRLTGSGTVEVTADAVRVLDARNEAPEKERTFAMADIANVGFAQKGNVVALRTRSDQREVLLWLASAEEVRALLELLPKTTTPEFLERQRQHEQFRQNLDAIAPRSPVTPTIVGMNVTPLDLLKRVAKGAASLLLYSLFMGAVMPFVDNSAHVGGMLGGAISGYLLARPFDPAVRNVARPWQVAGVIIAVTAALAALAAPLLRQ